MNQNTKETLLRFKVGSKRKRLIINIIVTVVFAFLYFYFKLPALNFQDKSLYFFLLLTCIVYVVISLITAGAASVDQPREYVKQIKSHCKVMALIALLIVAVLIVGAIISSVLFRPYAYSRLLTVEEGDFAAEVDEINFDQIPMLDTDSAMRLGDRKLGELYDVVSQFEVASDYNQINYKDIPVKVTPLEYGDIIKWLNNRSEGIPAYIIIDMVTQEAEVVRLEEGIKISPTEYFGRDLMRYLRFNYPTYMFDAPRFEIDDDGVPYWICSRIQKTIGLFGGTDIVGAVMLNAVTGESQYFDAADIPNWVDGVYSNSLIIEQYDFHGEYQGGWLNSILGQKNVTVTSDGNNYIAMNDDVYVYTGITSVGDDDSNIGFILVNQRTKEAKYYPCAGAAEYSAVSSAEGVVQDLGYSGTFPLLLNISGQPTYFIALKDSAQLVKMYAMVNVQQYQIVATGSTISECEANYITLMLKNNIKVDSENIEILEPSEISGKIAEIRTAVIEGNTWYYLKLAEGDVFYALSAAENESVIILDKGDKVTLSIEEAEGGDILNASLVSVD